MRKLFSITVLILISLAGFAQLSEGGMPASFGLPQFKSIGNIESLELKNLKIDKLIDQDLKDNIQNRYSIYNKVKIDIKKEGTITKTEGGTIWRYNIVSNNGFSIGLYFKKYHLPVGAKLFIYNSDYSLVYGAFTYKNNKQHGSLSIADFPEKNLIIEYFEPDNVEFDGELILGKVGQSYKNIHEEFFKSVQSDDNIDINCPDGDLVQLQKHSVAKMTFNVGLSGYLCTGALINNTQNNGTPYFLTANHCISSNVTASSLVTYFNYEKNDCNGTANIGATLSGASFKAGKSSSDFSLLLLDDTPPSSYQPYYSGWNAASSEMVKSGTGIHHPAGDVKKVAIEFDEIYSYPFELTWDGSDVTPENSHWFLYFDEGYTEGGSSGSPLFDENNLIIGQLHGGSEGYCFYGKISSSWLSSLLSSQQLKFWLDPSNSGVLAINGYAPSSNTVDAHFYTDLETVCAGEPIRLNDGSLFSPETWEWTFTPSTIDFHDGTNANSQNPVVSFRDNSPYTVSLTVTKGANSNTQTHNNYINSGTSLDLSLRPSGGTNLIRCMNNFQSVAIYSSGADSGIWSLENNSDCFRIDSLNSNKDSVLIVRNDCSAVDSELVLTIQYIGFHGSCSDTALLDLSFYTPSNDNIENAYDLHLGNNGPFDNFCASTQLNEPNPAGGNCESQLAWCDCNVSDTILENSVWFKFTAPASGIVGIDAPGFDNQIALYDAASANDIISGNSSQYVIVAANDDYYGEADDYSALIMKAAVEPGKTYWLQVDGSACGASGTFDLILYDYFFDPLNISSIESISKNPDNLLLYPNPASDFFVFTKADLTGEVEVNITSIDGKIINRSFVKSQSKGEYNVTIPNDLPDGLYIITITNGKQNFNCKLSVQRK